MSDSSSSHEHSGSPRIITFYSYKGGTGRSMALANVAWILASNGYKVLMIDWDLEAPGLHRWFGPLLDDPELQHSEGVINFFHDFVEGSRIEALERNQGGTPDDRWFDRYTDLARFAVGIDFEFPGEGLLNLVPAGRQTSEYAMLVQMFDWNAFYEQLGGGIFLEAVKLRLRREYDFILIDSRTGISDTSGICTVQMPDDLVVCFTLNRQSILGARGICAAADRQRRRPDGSPGLRIWPVPTRVELAEKERLDNARALMRRKFAGVAWQLNRDQRREYWRNIEILYVPYYACEEVLATLADTPGMTNTLLHSMETLTGWLMGDARLRCRVEDESGRLATLERYQLSNLDGQQQTQQKRRRLVLLYSQADIPAAEMAVAVHAVQEKFPDLLVFWDGLLPVGARWRTVWAEQIAAADIAIVFWGQSWSSDLRSEPWPLAHYAKVLAERDDVAVFPVVGPELSFGDLPWSLQERAGISWDAYARSRPFSANFASGKSLGRFMCETLPSTLDYPPETPLSSSSSHTHADPEDPNKGQFGGLARRNGTQLTASIASIPGSENWWKITLAVSVEPSSEIQGPVIFHLHPTFDEPRLTVPLCSGRAELVIYAWGSFTVGAELDGGRRRLELDLASLPDAPAEFQAR